MDTNKTSERSDRVKVDEVPDPQDTELIEQELTQVALFSSGTKLEELKVIGQRLSHRELIRVLESGIELLERSIIEKHLDEYPE